MSAIEQQIVKLPSAETEKARRESLIVRFLRLMSSVRLGVTLLCLLALACLIGMLVMQQNVEGFENYLASLTQSQRLVYGKLGFFDIYHSWYFNALLCVLSLNIIMASIDRFPRTWKFVSKRQLTPPVRWLKQQKGSVEYEAEGTLDSLAADAEGLLRSHGWRSTKIERKAGRTFVFGEKGVWNRLGAYPVHVALLTIFTGGFLTAQLGHTGNLPLAIGETSNLISETVVELDNAKEITKQLPFSVTFTDMQQKLIRDDGSLSAGNTIDWITRFTITDETGTHDGMVQMNRPFDYRGYRFFQASFTPVGRARSITVALKPANGGASETVDIPRDGTVTLANGTRIRFAEFRGNFRIGAEDPNEDTSTYPNPAAILQVTPLGGTVQTAYAFGPDNANIPVASKPVAGYTYSLEQFEKVADRHILSVQRDPGANVVYIGFTMLFVTLVVVFFFSHQRVWVVFEESGPGRFLVNAAGNTNRNQNAFEEKCAKFFADLKVGAKEIGQ